MGGVKSPKMRGGVGRLIFIHHQCWEVLPFCRFQRQRCTKILCPKDPHFYTPLALRTAKGQHLPALVAYKNQSPSFDPPPYPGLRQTKGQFASQIARKGCFFFLNSECLTNPLPPIRELHRFLRICLQPRKAPNSQKCPVSRTIFWVWFAADLGLTVPN